jgi:hypothetical protein
MLGDGHDWLFEIRFGPPAAHEPSVAEVVATIGFKRLDFGFIFRGNHRVPVQPKLPAVGHGISQINVHNASPFPVPAPPTCRMQAPEIRRPPLAKMIGNGPFDFPH